MGWSSTRIAGLRLDAISKLCDVNQNTWTDKGQEYFYETGREQRDGAICGTINKSFGNTCRKSGSFRIEPDGSVKRGPKLFKTEFLLLTIISNGVEYQEQYTGPKPVTEEILIVYLANWVKQWLKGGVNELKSGTIPYPNKAVVQNLDTDYKFEWNAPNFMVWN